MLLGFNHDTRIALYVTPVWIVALAIGYLASRKHHIRLTPVAAATAPTLPSRPTSLSPRSGRRCHTRGRQ